MSYDCQTKHDKSFNVNVEQILPIAVNFVTVGNRVADYLKLC